MTLGDLRGNSGSFWDPPVGSVSGSSSPRDERAVEVMASVDPRLTRLVDETMAQMNVEDRRVSREDSM